MREDYEAKHHRLEKSHWFLRSRRDLILSFIADYPRSSRVIEIGCSSGILLGELHEGGFQDLTGVDVSEPAILECRKAGVAEVRLVHDETLPFPDATFDLAIASDVLEHIPGDQKALAEWQRVLKPGGGLVLMVPAFQFLWSDHDVVNRHFRRYERKALLALLQGAGFTIVQASYWNALLFLPISLVRILLKLGKAKDQSAPPKDQLFESGRLTNGALRTLLRTENWLIRRGVYLPFGVSLVIRAQRPT